MTKKQMCAYIAASRFRGQETEQMAEYYKLSKWPKYMITRLYDTIRRIDNRSH